MSFLFILLKFFLQNQPNQASFPATTNKICDLTCGGVAEWSNAPVLKTGVAQVTVGSNPTPSAIFHFTALSLLSLLTKSSLSLSVYFPELLVF